VEALNISHKNVYEADVGFVSLEKILQSCDQNKKYTSITINRLAVLKN
jgi:hypothetical protein